MAGHPLLQPAAVSAALQARFAPTFLMGEAVKVTGVLVYNFVPLSSLRRKLETWETCPKIGYWFFGLFLASAFQRRSQRHAPKADNQRPKIPDATDSETA